MPSCCDDYGQCTQGPDCPARAAALVQVMPDQPAAPADSGRAVGHGGGNFWPATPQEPEFLTLADLLVVFALLLTSSAGIWFVLGYISQRWPL